MWANKNNSIYFYCSWILPYILAKAVFLEKELDMYLVQETEQALFYLKKLEEQEQIDTDFITNFSQFCVYVSNIRQSIQMGIHATEEINEEFGKTEYEVPIIFNSDDLKLVDYLLEVLYDVNRDLMESNNIDKSTNFLHSHKFFEKVSPLRSGPAKLIHNNYEISLKFK